MDMAHSELVRLDEQGWDSQYADETHKQDTLDLLFSLDAAVELKRQSMPQQWITRTFH
jgi:hypothetical protein